MQTRSERLRNIKASGIRRLFSLTQSTPDTISLGIGEPDFTPPQHVLDAATRAIEEGKTHYCPSRGVLVLREAVIKKHQRDYGLFYKPESEVLITVGATEATSLALLSFLNPGAEVLIPSPGFVCYGPAVQIAGGVPIPIPMLEDKGFKPDMSTVASLITEKSRLIIVNSPNNPAGSVLSYKELSELGKLAVENDLIVISDEVYEHITYDGMKHYSMATFPGMRERTVTVNSFSKTYAMTGFRIGYALGPENLIDSMLLAHQFLVACVDGPAQYAAEAALEGPQGFISEMVSKFDKRRRFVYRRLSEIEGFTCDLPKGAFYMFPNIKAFGMDSKGFSELLFESTKVVTTPGSAFGKYGEGFLRLSYATSMGKIVESLNRIERASKQLRKS